MRIIVHGPLAQVAEITPGRLVIEVSSVSDPYENRKGTPRLYRVYLEGEITSQSAPTLTPPPAAGSTPTSVPALPSVIPLEIPEGGER